MRDKLFHRHMISKRTAVAAIDAIAEELYLHGTHHYYGYRNGSAGEYDGAIRCLVNDIKLLKAEVTEYRNLKAALRQALKQR